MTFPDLITYLSETDAEKTGANGYGAMILYDNLGNSADATITTDSEQAGFEALNLFNMRPTNAWMAAAAGTHYVDVTLPAAAMADTFAFARYSLGDPDATVVLKSSADGITYSNCFPPIRMGDWFGRPKMIAFAPVTAAEWRVQIVSATAPTSLAVASFGPTYWPKYAELVGFRMFKTAREVEMYVATSEEGLMLGRTKLSVLLKSSITFHHMTEDELLFEWSPFMEHAESLPFFIAPLLTRFPDEVGYVESDGEIPSPAYSRHRRFSVTMPMRGCAP